MDKTELRQAAIRARAKLPGCEREAASRAICELLWAMPEVQGARVIFSYLAIAISAIGIFNNIVISFNQRRKEFAMMASVGMNGGGRKKLVLSESLLCVLIAVIIAVPFTLLTNRLVTGMLYYIGTPFDILYDWKGTPAFLVAFVGIVFIASLSTMRRSRNLSVVTELKYE